MMEEVMSMIFNGVDLVKKLEFSLSLQESPESLSNSLDSISTLFDDANKELKVLLARRKSLVPNQPEPKQVPMSVLDQMIMQIEPGLTQDRWLRQTVMQNMMSTDFAADSAFSTPRSRRRKNKDEEETVLAVAVGRMEILPADNYTWRKYGQKDILGSKFPRAYYRCINQKLYECPAKKQLQRLDEDPCTFRVTYLSLHTCHLFMTTPTISTLPAAETMFGNIDSVVPFGEEPYFNHDCLVPGDDCDGDMWNSPS